MVRAGPAADIVVEVRAIDWLADAPLGQGALDFLQSPTRTPGGVAKTSRPDGGSLMYVQNYLAQHVPSRETLMGFRGVSE